MNTSNLKELLHDYMKVKNQIDKLQSELDVFKTAIESELDRLGIDLYQSDEHKVTRSMFETTKYNVPKEVKAQFAEKVVQIRITIK